MKKIKLLFHILKLANSPQKNIESLIYLGDQVSNSQSAVHAAANLYKQEGFMDLYKNRSNLFIPTLKTLSSYPPGTLGYAMYKFYSKEGITIYPGRDVSEMARTAFITEMIRRNHDYLHVVFGFETDLEGEAQVNTFTSQQTRMPFSLMIVTAIILRSIFKNPRSISRLVD